MATTTNASIGEIKKVLGDVSNIEMNYDETKKVVNEYDGITIEGDLHQTKEHFGKLKFNFIELETKKEFFLRIKSHHFDDQLPPLETSVSEEKSNLKDIKASNAELKDQVEAQSSAFATLYDNAQTRKNETMEKFTQLLVLTDQNKAFKEKLVLQKEQIGCDKTQEEINKNLEQVASHHNNLKNLIENDEAELKALEAEAALLQSEVDQAHSQLKESKVQVDTLQSTRNLEGIKMSEEMEWVKHTSSWYSKLSGISIQSISNQSIQLTIDNHHVLIDADMQKMFSCSADLIVSSILVNGNNFRFDQSTLTNKQPLQEIIFQVQQHLQL